MDPQTNSTNAIAALASFAMPGLGQLIQARPFPALVYFAVEVLVWVVIGQSLLMVLGLIDGWGSPWCLLFPLISRVAAAHDCAKFKGK